MARLFVAFPVPSMVPLELQLKFSTYDLTPVKEFHLTLKFLGEVGASKIPEIVKRLQTVQALMPTLSFGHLGVFPHMNGKPRVLWVALRPEEPLQKLHNQVEQALSGIFPSNQDYKPHLTLGRFQSDKHMSALSSVLKMTPPHFTFMIKELYLYKSEQRDGKYTYTILAKIPLHS